MLVLLGLATLSFTAKDGVTLRLHPKKGKTYTITNKATTMNLMEVQGQTINQSQTLESRQTFTVKDVTDAETTMETQVEAIKMSIGQMGMKMEYDSDHPEKTSPMLADQTKEFEKSIKKPATVTYDALGNHISESEELDMSQLGAAILHLPEEELSVGSQWNADKKASVSGMDITSKMTYTVTAITKKSVEVSIKGSIEGNADGIKGTYEGTASIDPQTGLITKSNMKSNMSMTISQQGLSIPVTMVGNTTTTVE